MTLLLLEVVALVHLETQMLVSSVLMFGHLVLLAGILGLFAKVVARVCGHLVAIVVAMVVAMFVAMAVPVVVAMVVARVVA